MVADVIHHWSLISGRTLKAMPTSATGTLPHSDHGSRPGPGRRTHERSHRGHEQRQGRRGVAMATPPATSPVEHWTFQVDSPLRGAG